jgi:hypothetical protein
MNPIIELGSEVSKKWEKINYDPAGFSSIAYEALTSSPSVFEITLRDVAAWLIQGKLLPAQNLKMFAQPPVNVYHGCGFRIELLTWVDAPTTIHQHGFSGAFGVLHGSSLHTQYSFDVHERVSDQLLLGSLAHESSEVLRHSYVREIKPSSALIHTVLHLDAPSISVVVRTVDDYRYWPQYQYLPPALGVDPFYSPDPVATQLAFLETLHRTKQDIFRDLATDALINRSVWFAYKVLEVAACDGIESALFNDMLDVFRTRKPRLADAISNVFYVRQQRSIIRRCVRATTSWEHRLLLALRLGHASRESMLCVLSKEFPNSNTPDKIIDLLGGLAAHSELKLPNSEAATSLLRRALQGASLADVRTSWTNYNGELGNNVDSLEKAWKALQASPFLEPIIKSSDA